MEHAFSCFMLVNLNYPMDGRENMFVYGFGSGIPYPWQEVLMSMLAGDRRSQPHELRLPTVGGVAGEGVVGQGHGGLAVHHVPQGVEVGVLEGVLVLPGLLNGGLLGGEEERGALRPHMTPCVLLKVAFALPVQAWMTSSTSPACSRTCRIGTSGLSSKTPCSQSVRAQGGLSAARRGRVRRMRAMVVPEGIATLVAGWTARSVQPNPLGPA